MNALDKFKQQFKESAGIKPVDIKQVNDTVVFSKECSVLKTEYAVVISLEEFNRINTNNEHTNQVLKHRHIDEIEFIISGTTPAEWNKLMN